MTAPRAHGFAAHFCEKMGLMVEIGTFSGRGDAESGLRKLWEMSELSASEFADEVGRFYDLPRTTLQDLMAAQPRVQQFSRRFLRDMAVFPHQSVDGEAIVAIADPSDSASIQAAEIVMGAAPLIKVASFEDIATALDQRLGEDPTPRVENTGSDASLDDDIDNLRDLASGAPVVRAVNDLFETAVELRASDIHIEPVRSSLVIRMRIDGLLRIVPTPSGIPPQAIISRIKIIAGLNIAERRLPQDGAARLRVARAEIDMRVAIIRAARRIRRDPPAAEGSGSSLFRETRLPLRR